ncbi:HAD family phosphatase [Nocardioides sp.]|uniref:HAD family hydrolase n=1 Tax=Nocardioides sp. TaxID=35761 RepID=UPI002BAB7346|nr:HAD family phosphatase [Nocardioides sp.]HSX67771.1 HAD family phosphatase [Nocardioides sp.]
MTGGPPLVDAVLFDYGGVMTGPVGDSIRAWHTADGIDPASFTRTLKQWLSRTVNWETPIHQLETGALSIAEFERIFAAELTTVDGVPPEAAGILGRMFAGMRPDPVMFELVEELRDCGIRVGLLSNSWGNTYPRPEIDELFDPVVISGEIGLRKPHATIYQHALEQLDLPAGRVLFVDDAEPNIIGAQSVGLRALLHTSPRCTRAALAALVPALSPTPREVLA